MEEYHPAFGHPPVHDHHRRARRLLVGAVLTAAFGAVSVLWSGTTVWGERQVDLARWVGWAAIVVAAVAFVTGISLWFAVDDDQHPELPED